MKPTDVVHQQHQPPRTSSTTRVTTPPVVGARREAEGRASARALGDRDPDRGSQDTAVPKYRGQVGNKAPGISPCPPCGGHGIHPSHEYTCTGRARSDRSARRPPAAEQSTAATRPAPRQRPGCSVQARSRATAHSPAAHCGPAAATP
eukprot:6488175-Prymnesium_polylepis.1